jgi:hypothetical protein
VRPEIFAEFLARQGYHIFETESCFWYNAQPGFYFYFPYHRLISPSIEEMNRLLWGRPCIGARFFVPLNGVGRNSYLIVCSNKNYDIISVDAKYARRQTRRGLENFEIRQIDFGYLASHGCKINYDTMMRQGRDPRKWNEKYWRQYCLSAQGLEGFEAWGAFTGKHLAAFLVAFQMEDYFTILNQSSASEYLRSYPNNALVFYVTKHKLASEMVGHVSYGPESLDAPASLDKFKFRMGFTKSPMKQKIVFNPVLRPFVNPISHKFVKQVASANPKSDICRKIEGIFRFYQEAN